MLNIEIRKTFRFDSYNNNLLLLSGMLHISRAISFIQISSNIFGMFNMKIKKLQFV